MSQCDDGRRGQWHPRRRRRTIAAVSRSPLVALVAVALAATGGAAGPTAASRARPPSALADGSRPLQLPPTVRRFEGRPVVGARRLVRPSVPAWCGADRRDSRRRGWLSPDG